MENVRMGTRTMAMQFLVNGREVYPLRSPEMEGIITWDLCSESGNARLRLTNIDEQDRTALARFHQAHQGRGGSLGLPVLIPTGGYSDQIFRLSGSCAIEIFWTLHKPEEVPAGGTDWAAVVARADTRGARIRWSPLPEDVPSTIVPTK